MRAWRVLLAIPPIFASFALAQTPPPADPEVLFEAARRGDRAAVVSLLDRHRPRLCGW